MPVDGHCSFDQEQILRIIEAAYTGILLSGTKGAWDVSDEFNKLFPDFMFVGIDDFLGGHWSERP